METRLKEYDRARVIYKVSSAMSPLATALLTLLLPQFALSRLPRSKSASRACQLPAPLVKTLLNQMFTSPVYTAYTKFEKQREYSRALSELTLP
jgi:hypothetical protein